MRHVHGVLQKLRAVTVTLGQEQGGRNGGTWGQRGRVERVDTLRTYTHSGESTRWRITHTHTQSLHRTQTVNTCDALNDHRAVDDSPSEALPNVRKLFFTFDFYGALDIICKMNLLNDERDSQWRMDKCSQVQKDTV